MIRVESASRPPGQCAATGKSDGPFVDTLIDIDDLPAYGRIYLSYDWVRTAAMELCDMRPRSEVERLQEKLDQTEAQLAIERQQNDDLFHVKQILDDWKGPSMSRMPTPTELRREAEPEVDEPEVVDSPPEPSPEILELADAHIAELTAAAELLDLDEDDTPGALADDDSAILLIPPADEGDEAVIRAFYGEAGDLEALLALDPPPEKVDDITTWIAAGDHPVIERVRTELAVLAEKRRPDNKQRPTVLALEAKEPGDADDHA